MARPALVYDKLSSCPSNPAFDAALLRRYDRPGPRYTSYPTAPQFTPASTSRRCARRRARATATRSRGRCRSTCTCRSARARASTAAATASSPATGRARDAYLARLYREIALTRGDVRSRPRSGPAALRRRHAQLPVAGAVARGRRLRCAGSFHFADCATRDLSIELDPRFISPADVAELARRSASTAPAWACRISTRRCRPRSTASSRSRKRSRRDRCLPALRLPLGQRRPDLRPAEADVDGFARTLDTVIAARPDRLAVYGYAHLPELFKAQRQIDAARPARRRRPSSRCCSWRSRG